MRWLVEVSRVSDGSPTERYCIDARRWQSALQEVRRLRGDEGPLPKLTIELLDAGYRAVDPELKVRYIVSEAPADMPVTVGAQVRHSTQPPPADGNGSVALPVAKAPLAVGGVAATPSIAAPTSPSVPVGASHASDPPGLIAAQIIRQRDESPTPESPIHYREIALAVRPGASKDGVEALMRARLEQARTSLDAGEAQQYVQIAVFDHMFVKRPVRAPVATLAWKNWRGDPVLAFPGFAQKTAESMPSSAGPPSTRPPSWGGDSDAPPAGSLAPAPVVAIGAASPVATAPQVAAAAPAGAAPAVTAPTAVAPTIATAVPRPGAVAPLMQPEPIRSSVIPAPVVSVGVSRPSQPPPEPDPPPPDSEDIPVPLVAKRGDVLTEDEVEISIDVPPPSGPFIDVAISSIPVSELPASAVPPAPSTPEPEIEAAPPAPRPRSIPPPKPNTVPPPKPASVPPLGSPVPSSRPTPIPASVPRRRAASEDLIGDLFERMHELAFMADLISGAEFIVQVLGELIPCEAVAVHVYDLGKREFVVVRAHGPKARDALLYRTADAEPLIRDIMSRRSATILDGAPANPPPASGSLTKLGIEPRAVLYGAARLGGRYLGLIELANPHGSEPFHANEANALDYVCEQFAEFVASRPIVLDADVVIGQ